jgi:TonB family protein
VVPLVSIVIALGVAMSASPLQVQPDGFADVVRAADLTIRPTVLEKRLPAFGDRAVNGPAGVLRIEFVVEHDGTVKFARAIGETALYGPLVGDVIGLLKRWKFVPGTKADVVVRTLATLSVTYAPGGSRGGGTAKNVGSWLVDGADDEFGAGAVRFGDPGVVWARVKKDSKPSYPDAMRRERTNGLVSLEVIIETTGRISGARVVSSSDARFEASALACARQWQFEPALKDSQPHRALATLVLEFRIN